MENVRPVIDIVKLVGPTIWKYIKYQTVPSRYVKEWDTQIKSMDRRFNDIGDKLKEQLKIEKIPKLEVEDWLKKAKEAIDAADESHCNIGGCFCNICRSKHFDERALELKKMFADGEKYTNVDADLVKDDHSIINERLMRKIEVAKESLQDRKKDIESRLQHQRCHGVVVRDEVKSWLKKAGKEVDEEIVSQGGCLSPSRLVPLLHDKIGELDTLLSEGKEYTNAGADLVKEDPSISRGTPLLAEKLYGVDDVLAEIPMYLKRDQAMRIAVWGMGGIGKTTLLKQIHNQFLKESQFDKVIWFTVSSKANVFDIQNAIAKQLINEELEEKDAIKREGKISEMLRGGNYILILDDVWDGFVAEEVGIPEPDNCGDNCLKLVLTTRSKDVADQTGCIKVFKLEPLDYQKALELFLDRVGEAVLTDDKKSIKPTLYSTLKQVVEECDGLPLAIVTVASTMRGKPERNTWVMALKQLQEGKIVVSGKKDPMGTLKFSYDGLENEKLQHCFLYCALYPEDFEIPKTQLIEYWIEEGLIDQTAGTTRHEMFCEGHEILRKLEGNCLLECIRYTDDDGDAAYESKVRRIFQEVEDEEEEVKMHDLHRDMALNITSKSPLFFVKAGVSTDDLLKGKEWASNVEKVSLMKTCCSEGIPLATTNVKYNMLTTLLMPDSQIVQLPELFFTQMPVLKILDLSGNDELSSLPDSISSLENLITLLLQGCRSLKKVPSLSKCKGLTKLDLSFSGIEQLPDGMAMLRALKYLDLGYTMIKKLPENILPQLANLEYLSVMKIEIRAEEIFTLKKLEYFFATQEGRLDEMSILGWIQSKLKQLQVEEPEFLLLLGENLFREYHLLLNGKWICNLEYSTIDKDKDCHHFRCLDHVLDNDALNGLRALQIADLENIECAFNRWLNPLHSLESLMLYGLENMKSVFDEEAFRLPAPQLPCNSFLPLTNLIIRNCDKLKKLFTSAMLLGYLQNLEYIEIGSCDEMEEIISSEEEEALQNITLPKLKMLTLKYMPSLTSICNSSSLLVCDRLEFLRLWYCDELKRIPLYLPQLNGAQPSAPPSLRKIVADDEDWWESTEWCHPNARDILLPLCQFEYY